MTVTLPEKATEEGAVARLLLAEARDPSSAYYAADDTLKSMQWMKLILQNRLQHDPAQFMARHAKSLIDIIKAPGQFAGFQHYPAYSSDLQHRLQSFVDIANSTSDHRALTYTTFARNALSVAKAPAVTDPSVADTAGSSGLIAWRTAGSGSPGPRFVKYKDLAGNSFYSLHS